MKPKPVCRRCGACCRWWVTYEWMPDPQMLERWKVSGVRAYRTRFGGKPGVVLYIPYRCPQLTRNNRCRLHGPNKPQLCREYPRKDLKYIMPDGCVFIGKQRGWSKLSDNKPLTG